MAPFHPPALRAVSPPPSSASLGPPPPPSPGTIASIHPFTDAGTQSAACAPGTIDPGVAIPARTATSHATRTPTTPAAIAHADGRHPCFALPGDADHPPRRLVEGGRDAEDEGDGDGDGDGDGGSSHALIAPRSPALSIGNASPL